jgi:uncharacterized protein YbcV (DUF1398 family)
MDERSKSVAKRCLQGAEEDSMTFPEIVGRLRDAGFEGYAIDFRRAHATYYMPDGGSVDLPMHEIHAAIAPVFEAGRVQAAIKEAQQLAPGYTYRGFCNKVATAGCAGYIVSFSGRRALYFGRTAETHVEHFPD